MSEGRHAAAPRRTGAGVGERVLESLLLGCGLICVATTLAILVVLADETLAFVRAVSIVELFTDTRFGVWPLIAGTFLTATIAIVVALPLGLLAAIYLAEFARPGLRRVLEPTLELLAGIPTIVYGYFALVFLTPLLQRVVPGLAGFNALSPGIVMGIMIVPMIASLGADAIHAVPRGVREAAWGLGAGQVRTILQVVLPSAFSGIAAAVVLAISRAIGETMIVTLAAGQQPRLTLDPRVPIETMTAYIAQVGLGDAPADTLEYRAIFVVGATLFVLTSIANLFAQRLARRFREERE